MPTNPRSDASLDVLATESVRPDLDDLDRRPTGELVRTFVEGQHAAHTAALAAVPALAAAADAIAARLARGGRLFYLGAGTSGRLAILDASECPPTFNTSPDLVVALIAGGPAALIDAIEGAEDDVEAGAAELRARNLAPDDAVVGITASGRTPYVIGALRYARELGCYTVAIVNNAHSPLAQIADNAVELLTGAEVIAGSTRLCAGTAQKIALSTLSSAVMVRLGKTYGQYMVDVRASNAKLRRRALRMVEQITGADESASAVALEATSGQVKPAVVMLLGDCDAAEAARRLDAAHGRVREARGLLVGLNPINPNGGVGDNVGLRVAQPNLRRWDANGIGIAARLLPPNPITPHIDRL
jgi:N-acetylmuramic acid 6-phosphate etherase